MALKQSYDNQTEIPQGLQEHYVDRDGRWILQTDPQIEDVSGLKSALDKERGLRRDAEKTMTDMKVQFEGVDPAEYRKLQERVKGLDDVEVYDRQGIEALVTKRTESMKTEHERQIGSKDREIAQLRTQASDADKRWRQDRIRTALLDAVTKHGVYEKAVDDAVARGLGIFSDLDDQGQVVAKKGEDLVYGKDGINPLRPDEWISTLKTSGQAPHLWPPSSGSGTPAYHGSNGGGIDWNSITNPAERMTRFREWQATQKR